MLGNVDRNRAVLRGWIDVLNNGDWEKIKAAYIEHFTKDYLLHDPSFPNQVKTFDQFIDGFELEFPRFKNIKATLEDCIGEGDLLASRCTWEAVDVETEKKYTTYFIFFSRFEDGRIAEEWQVAANIE